MTVDLDRAEQLAALQGANAPLVVERYRRDAVAAVWDAHRTTEPRP